MTSPNEPKYDHRIKLVVVGNAGVGKKSIVMRLTNTCIVEAVGLDQAVRTFEREHPGTGFMHRVIERDGEKIMLQVWPVPVKSMIETTGREYQGAHGVIFVYDVTDKESFEGLINWVNEADRHSPDWVCRLMLGNKADLPAMGGQEKRDVEKAEAQTFAEMLEIPFREVSANFDGTVEEAFLKVLLPNIIGREKAKGKWVVEDRAVEARVADRVEAPLGPGIRRCCVIM